MIGVMSTANVWTLEYYLCPEHALKLFPERHEEMVGRIVAYRMLNDGHHPGSFLDLVPAHLKPRDEDDE